MNEGCKKKDNNINYNIILRKARIPKRQTHFLNNIFRLPLTVSELELQLARIAEDAAKQPKPRDGAGLFTTLPREEWATIRSELYKDPINKEIFDSITNCSMV